MDDELRDEDEIEDELWEDELCEEELWEDEEEDEWLDSEELELRCAGVVYHTFSSGLFAWVALLDAANSVVLVEEVPMGSMAHLEVLGVIDAGSREIHRSPIATFSSASSSPQMVMGVEAAMMSSVSTPLPLNATPHTSRGAPGIESISLYTLTPDPALEQYRFRYAA